MDKLEGRVAVVLVVLVVGEEEAFPDIQRLHNGPMAVIPGHQSARVTMQPATQLTCCSVTDSDWPGQMVSNQPKRVQKKALKIES